MAKAFLLDAYVHPRRSSLVVWAKRGSETLRTEVPYRPDFCIQSDGKPLAEAERWLEGDKRVERFWRAKSKVLPGGPEVEVLRIRPWSLHDVHRVATDLRKRIHTKGFLFFDVDHQHESRWMASRGLFPLCRLQDGAQLGLVPHASEDRSAYDYEDPGLKTMALAAHAQVTGLKPNYADIIERILVNDHELECAGPDDEKRVLLQLDRLLRAADPDVITTWGGDEWDIPYLLSKLRQHGLSDRIWLGRAADPDPDAPDQKEKSVSTYGRVLWRTHAYYLRGRFHIDMGKKSLADNPERADLHGLVYMTRISNRRLQDVNRNGPGYCLQQIQIDEAQKEGVALPWKRNLSEDWKDVATLCAVDRGGQIMKPDPGIYGDVWSCDFSSYYPSIVVGRNLSSDTINCACCPDSTQVIPELGYHVCQRRGQGHQVRVLAPTVIHRRHIKALLRRAKHQERPDDEVAKATAIKGELKGLGVVCFGYFRYRNARYGCAEVHQAIQAYGRQGMTTAKSVAESHGYRVLHTLTDCILFQRKGATRTEVRKLAAAITKAVEAPMDIEGRFKWLVLLPSKGNSTEEESVGVPNRYYGLFEDGELKLRGIELRRHSTPPFIQDVQRDMLCILKQAEDSRAFRARIPAALEVAHVAALRLRNRQVALHELVILARTRQSVEEYTQQTPARTALLKLRDAGMELKPGQSVPYVMTRASGPAMQRSVPASLIGQGPFSGATPYDVNGYLRLLARSVETLLSPFGYDEEPLFAWLSGQGLQPAMGASDNQPEHQPIP